MNRRGCRRRLAVGPGPPDPGRWPCAATTSGCSAPVRFHDITELDVTPAFAATAAAWLAETEPHAEELARLEPPGAFAQRQADRRSMLAAIGAGLLRRALLLARTA